MEEGEEGVRMMGMYFPTVDVLRVVLRCSIQRSGKDSQGDGVFCCFHGFYTRRQEVPSGKIFLETITVIGAP